MMRNDVQAVALVISVGLFLLVLELVRKGRLREDYSRLWFLTAVAVLVLALWHDLLMWLTRLVGAVNPASTIFLLGVVFLVLISMHLCVIITKLTNQTKELAQSHALLKKDLEDLRELVAKPGPDSGNRNNPSYSP